MSRHRFSSPGKLRRGAATQLYRLGLAMSTLLLVGRWQHLSTARLYVNEAAAELAEMRLSVTPRRALDERAAGPNNALGPKFASPEA